MLYIDASLWPLPHISPDSDLRTSRCTSSFAPAYNVHWHVIVLVSGPRLRCQGGPAWHTPVRPVQCQYRVGLFENQPQNGSSEPGRGELHPTIPRNITPQLAFIISHKAHVWNLNIRKQREWNANRNIGKPQPIGLENPREQTHSLGSKPVSLLSLILEIFLAGKAIVIFSAGTSSLQAAMVSTQLKLTWWTCCSEINATIEEVDGGSLGIYDVSIFHVLSGDRKANDW